MTTPEEQEERGNVVAVLACGHTYSLADYAFDDVAFRAAIAEHEEHPA